LLRVLFSSVFLFWCLLEQEGDGVELLPEFLLCVIDGRQELSTLISAVEDRIASAVHNGDELALDLAFKSRQISLETRLGTRSGKRHGDIIEGSVARNGCVDTKRRRDASTIGACGKTKAGRTELLPTIKHIASRYARRRDKLGRKELRIGPTSLLVALEDELEVDRCIFIPEITTVKAEAMRIHGICRTPALDILVAKEVDLRNRATRDTACQTRRLASGTVVNDLLRGDVERHF
jgi:hypothetical protein